MEENRVKSGSPGVSPVELSDCLEHLLNCVLRSSIDGTHDFNLGLSAYFCSTLLKQDDFDNPFHHQNLPTSTNFSEGVPTYPLYKHLASALQQWIISGSFSSSSENVPFLCEDETLKDMKIKWNELVSQKGSELVNMFKRINFELHVQEPYFSLLKDGKKTIEGRCAVGNYNRIRSGDLILFNKCLMVEVQDVHRYHSFMEMLEAEKLEDVLPGVQTVDEGEQIYRKFYTEEKEQLNGVLAIYVGKLASQPYIVLSDTISGLGYRGIQSLLGLKQTVGTIAEALPPPRSALLSSFAQPHKSNIKGCTLIEGARALTKHVSRCSSNYWGKIGGNDFNKNRLAMEVIICIIGHCRWLNVHFVQPHGPVFEIRISEGYGTRWSEDGTKFIGFLEPYMEDGHSKQWRH